MLFDLLFQQTIMVEILFVFLLRMKKKTPEIKGDLSHKMSHRAIS